MKTKTKALAVSLCAILLVVASVMGTMAYLTSTETVKNTFTVGKVGITLDEAAVYEDGTLKENEDGEHYRVQENKYHLLPGHTYTKDPTIHVDAKSEDCFIRAKVTLTNANEWVELAKQYADNLVEKIILGTDDNIWWVSDPVVDKENNVIVYTFVYKNESKKDESLKRVWQTGDPTDLVLFNKIKMPEKLTNEDLAKVDDTTITVVAEAIQADGFETADDAWAAFSKK